MTSIDLDERSRAHVSEQEFMDYLAKTAERDDYTKDWRECECRVYFNSAGCKLALYNRDYNYGEIF